MKSNSTEAKDDSDALTVPCIAFLFFVYINIDALYMFCVLNSHFY